MSSSEEDDDIYLKDDDLIGNYMDHRESSLSVSPPARGSFSSRISRAFSHRDPGSPPSSPNKGPNKRPNKGPNEGPNKRISSPLQIPVPTPAHPSSPLSPPFSSSPSTIGQLRRRVKTMVHKAPRQSIATPLSQDERERLKQQRRSKHERKDMDMKERAKDTAYGTFNKVLNKVADRADGRSKSKDGEEGERSGSQSGDIGPDPFGSLKVFVKQAHLCGRKCNKKTGAHYYCPVDKNGKVLDDGQTRFLCTVTFEDLFKQTASMGSSEPVFAASGSFGFPVYDYHSKIYIDVFDEFTSNLVGDCEVSVFSIIERQTQKMMKQLGGFKTTFIESGDKKVTILETLKSLNSNDECEWVNLHDDVGDCVGKVLLAAEFKEDNLMQCISTAPPEDDCLSSEFTLEGLKNASVRISKLIKIKNDLLVKHQRILQFERYHESIGVLVGSIAFCLYFNAEYIPMYMSGFVLGLFVYNLNRRINGSSIIHLLHDQDASTLERQIGKLRVAVVGGTNLMGKSKLYGTQKIAPLVRCFYVPLDEEEVKKDAANKGTIKIQEKQQELREKKHVLPTRSIAELSKEATEKAKASINKIRAGDSNQFYTHRYYIGRTVTVENTTEPLFQSAQTQQDSSRGGKFDEAMSKKMKEARKWINARSKLRKAGVKDAVLHNVTSSWKHEDGVVDWHCLKYPILQETFETNKKVRKWSECQGALHFDIMSAHDLLSETFIGRCSIPMSKLVDKPRGGVQSLIDVTLEAVDAKKNKVGEVRLRLQFKLPFISEPFTELDRMNMESLQEMLDTERDLGLVGRVKKVRDLAMGVQLGLERMANYGERMKNILLWVHPKKSLAIFLYIFAGFTATCLIPMRYLMIYQILKDFYKGWKRKPKTRKFYNRCDNLLNTIPTDEEFSGLFAKEREGLKALTAQVQHSEKLKVGLQALYTGTLMKRGTFNTAWKNRFVAVRSGFLVWWKVLAHAEQGMPERGKLYLFEAPLFCIDLSGCDDLTEFKKRDGGAHSKDDEQPLIMIEKKSPDGVQFRLKGKESLDGKWVYRDFLCDSVHEFELLKNAINNASEGGMTTAASVR